MVLIEPTPRLPCSGTEPGAEPACKINAALLALDQEALALPCGLLDDATIAAQGLDPGRNPLQMWYAHWVVVTHQGASFYSLTLHADAFCPGGAHGWTEQSAVLFDLTTGAKVDPFTLLPVALRPDTPFPPAPLDPVPLDPVPLDPVPLDPAPLAPDGQTPPPLTAPPHTLPPLTALYLEVLAKTDPTGAADCAGTITQQQALTPDQTMDFLLYPEAATRSLILTPQGLAHAARPCEIGVPLDLPLLESLGADPRLIVDLQP
ncbi:hypothetical protein NX862_15445 [Rhodobacter sp. KR11]|uniref:hypothetical protein n=1 Tax=Rhodobacter sp. KR11 TaxID=2974588 RepID=UPI0022219358|nr:hypothetical protein [Rhodobacter sp. KR11]MCW1920154.1 hypothetical protein [Rhodobacter sp. KR11]